MGAPAAADQTIAARRHGRPRRLSPEQRSRDIVAEAVEYFAEVGFEGGTRELARRLGVTQPLLYSYFPSKDDLVQEVYRRVYLDRWNPAWDDLLTDRSRPLRERLEVFYAEYTDRIFSRKWIRIYLFAGLRGVEINRWYNSIVEDSILKRLVREFRVELGLDEHASISREEIELFWTMHGGIFYYGVRKHIYGFDVLEDKQVMINNALDVYFGSAKLVLDRSGRGRSDRGASSNTTAEKNPNHRT